MSEPKWTPGPWRHVSTKGGWDGVADSADSGICLLSLNNPANADLIAAAPELYEFGEDALSALHYIEQRYGRLEGVGWDRVYGKSAALAKARGDDR